MNVLVRRCRSFRNRIDDLRGAKDFLPRSDPGFIEIPRFVARIAQNHDRILRGNDRRPQERPERPMRSVKSADEQVAETRRGFFCVRYRCTIGFVDKLKSAITNDFLETCRDLA